MSDEPLPNVDLVPNVMVAKERPADEIAELAGDLAVRIYKKDWPNPAVVRAMLTDVQYVEYEQYMVCLRCGKPCAGTCDGSARNPSGPREFRPPPGGARENWELQAESLARPIFRLISNFVHLGRDGASHQLPNRPEADAEGMAQCPVCGEVARVEFGIPEG